VSGVMTTALVIFMLLQPAIGSLSDRIGRRTSMLVFSGLATLASVPLIGAIGHASTLTGAAVLVLLGLLIGSFYTSISGVVKAELFPSTVRALGVGMPYAVANAVFGGSAEYFALSLKSAGYEGVFAWYVAAMAAITFCASFVMPDTRRRSYLDGTWEDKAS